MVVCKYFLQGTCKFGTYCNYEHQAPGTYTGFGKSFNDINRQSTSILRQPNFSSAQVQSTKPSSSTGNVDINTLVKSVINDMTGAEKGGQWLLSCYAPFKEKPALPGFEDQSPEEIRLGFYEAQKNGTLEPYKVQLQALLQTTMMKIKALQNPPQDVVAVLQNIYNTPPSSYSGTYGQNVTTATTSNLNQQNSFTIQTQNQSNFGQNNIFKSNNQSNNTNIFGGGGGRSPQSNFSSWQQSQGQTDLFGNVQSSPTPNQNIFGGNTYGNTQNNIFGNQQGSNIFASPGQTPNSIFASPALPHSPQSSVFGDTQTAQPSTNIFASTVPTNQIPSYSSQSINQQSLFGQQQNQQEQHINIFATQNQPQNIQTQNIFLQTQKQQQPNIFNANTNSTKFTNQLTNIQGAPSNYSASIFGYSANSNPSPGFGLTGQQSSDENIYSKLEELSDSDKTWFESNNTLDTMNIPDKPPTYDMCFKV